MYVVEFYVNVSPCPYFIGTENIHYGYYNNAKEFVLRAIHTLWNMTEDFSLKALVLGTIIMSASAEAESSWGRRP